MENQTISTKKSHNGDINTEDFYIPVEADTSNQEFEINANASFTQDLASAKEKGDTEINEEVAATSVSEGKPSQEPLQEPILKKEVPDQPSVTFFEPPEDVDEKEDTAVLNAEQPETDFFDKTVVQQESTKAIAEIAGMTEVSEIKEDEVKKDEEKENKDDIEVEEFEIRESKPSIEVKGPISPTGTGIESTKRQSMQAFDSRKSISSAKSFRSPSDPRGSRQMSIKTSMGSDSRRDRMDSLAQVGSMSEHLSKFYVPMMPLLTASREVAKYRNSAIGYGELGPRIRGLQEEDEFTIELPIETVMFDEVVEEEEQIAIEEEEAMPVLDRIPYYERHEKASDEVMNKKIKNFVLQKMLAMYFKRKKMDYVTKETDWSFDLQSKYFRKLEAFGELREFDANQRALLKSEIEGSKKVKDDKFKELTTMFKKMQNREAEIGYGLINTKTGKAIPDKLVERLINRQLIQMGQVCSMRLSFIRLKGMVQGKLDSIALLDEIAPGYLLADYEQLKVLNQSYSDKIEEKDEELCRLRSKCGNTIQVLAHLREKSFALENDLNDLLNELDDTRNDYSANRVQLNSIKQRKDHYRQNINNMREDSGLLTQPTLLRDMEQGLTDVKILSANLENIMHEHKKRSKQIKIIRQKIEVAMKMHRPPKYSCSKQQALATTAYPVKSKNTIYRGKPSLMMPEIKDSAFAGLTTVKPKLTCDRSRHAAHVKHSKRMGG